MEEISDNKLEGYIQILVDVGYMEEEIYKYIEKGLTKEIFERLIAEKEESVSVRNGQVKFKYVNHKDRAEKFGRISDGDTTAYLNVALEYFEHRCALSGESFENFGRGKLQNSAARSNLSAEHIVPLCQGGDDVVPNLVPSVLQYNISKNGYNLLDWWTKQKDSQGKTIYSSYRLLKLVNYMLKSEQARGLNIKEFKKVILTPNEIDRFIKKIEQKDEVEEDNNKRKIISDNVTSTTEMDGKRFLTEIPRIEGDIPKQSEQELKIEQDIHMMDIFLLDSINVIKSDIEIAKEKVVNQNGNEIDIARVLDEMFEKTRGTIPFEIEVRNLILDKLKSLEIKENLYTIANELMLNTDILKLARENKKNLESYIEKSFYENIQKIIDKSKLTEEQIRIAIKNIPEVLYNSEMLDILNLYMKYIDTKINYEIVNKTFLKNTLKIKEWMEKNNTTKTPKRYNNSIRNSEEETKLAIQLDTIRQTLIKPYTELENENEKKEYKKGHPELEEVMKIVEEIDKNNARVKEDSQYYWHILSIKEWMDKNKTTKPPRAQNKAKTIPEEEGVLGSQLSAIRQQLIKPYNLLKSKQEKEEYKKQHPELEEIIIILEEIDKNNVRLKEDSALYWNAFKIKEWMEENNTTKPPSKNAKSTSEEEKKLGRILSNIRQSLIKPYKQLESEEEKEEYKKQHPELEEVMEIIEWIDKNNVRAKEDSQYYWNILEIKKWMEENNTTRPPRCQTSSQTIPEKEGILGTQLSNIRRFLIRPYTELENEEEKEDYKEEHPELKYVMKIVEWIDQNNIKAKEDSKDYRNILEIKKWMEENNTTKPPRAQNKNKTVPEEEAKLGSQLSGIRYSLVKPYIELEDEEQKEIYKIEHPELDDVMVIIEWIDKNNVRTKEESQYYWDILEIKKWMEENNITKSPRCQNSDKTIPKEEARLGNKLSKIRQNLIKPYIELENEEKKEEYKKKHPELEEVMSIIEKIDCKVKEESKFYLDVLAIKEWMEKNNTTKPPRCKSDNKAISEEEGNLGNQLRYIRANLIKPYNELDNEEEKEEYKIKHPELEEVIKIVEEIDRNNVRLKEDSSFYWNALKIKEWMEKNQVSQPPRNQYKSRKTGENAVPIEEARLGDKLSEIRMNLISPYSRLVTEKDKELYRTEHPELEEVLQIIEWIDNRIPEKLQQARDIKTWMKNKNTTNPPRATIRRNNKALRLKDMDEIEKEEYMLGTALRRIRTKLINPYNKLETNEEKEECKRNNPELLEVMEIVREIDRNNRKVEKNNLKQIVLKQKQNGLLGKNIEVESTFDEIFERIEHNLSNEQEI